MEEEGWFVLRKLTPCEGLYYVFSIAAKLGAPDFPRGIWQRSCEAWVVVAIICVLSYGSRAVQRRAV